MSAELFNAQEVRIRNYGATPPTGFLDANAATWGIAGGPPTVYKLGIVDNAVELTGFNRSRLRNALVRTRKMSNPPGTAIGPAEATFKLSVYLNSDGGTGQTIVRDLLSWVLGGISSPSTASFALGGGTHTVSRLYAAAVAAAQDGMGTGVLCGSKGDAKGEGQLRVLQGEFSAGGAGDYIDLAMDLPGIPADSDTIYLCHTVYPDETASPQYLEFLFIGNDGTSPDQVNVIGCFCTGIELSGLAVEDGEEPKVTFNFQAMDYRLEPSATKATIAQGTAPYSPDSAQNKGQGGIFLGDEGLGTAGQSYGYVHGGDVSLELDYKYKPLKSRLGLNGIASAKTDAGEAKWSLKAVMDEGTPNPLSQFKTDFNAKTAKQLMIQCGSEAGACVGIEMSNTYFDREPYPDDHDGWKAAALEGHADEYDSGSSELQKAAFRFHFPQAS